MKTVTICPVYRCPMCDSDDVDFQVQFHGPTIYFCDYCGHHSDNEKDFKVGKIEVEE